MTPVAMALNIHERESSLHMGLLLPTLYQLQENLKRLESCLDLIRHDLHTKLDDISTNGSLFDEDDFFGSIGSGKPEAGELARDEERNNGGEDKIEQSDCEAPDVCHREEEEKKGGRSDKSLPRCQWLLSAYQEFCLSNPSFSCHCDNESMKD
ncbi:hypothetical protein Q8A73_008456 [Channa argus]|nr:hypothetical protein Q8A73_008456 [Channa argus]